MDTKQASTCFSSPAPEAEARVVAQHVVDALRAGFDEMDRIVAASRANAERMLLDVEAWARDGVVPPRARRYAEQARGEGDLDDDSFCDFDVHQVASVALHGVGMGGDLSFLVAAVNEMGDMWNRHDDLYKQAGDAARAAFIAAAQRRAANNA